MIHWLWIETGTAGRGKPHTIFQIGQAYRPERKRSMKKQDIRRIYTQKVTELLAQGYTIYPDTVNSRCQ